MVTFRLIEETGQYLTYWYFPNGNEDEMYGLRNSINETRKEEGLPLLTEEEWPSATTALTKTFFADHAISKIIESYNSGEILKEGMSAWY